MSRLATYLLIIVQCLAVSALVPLLNACKPGSEQASKKEEKQAESNKLPDSVSLSEAAAGVANIRTAELKGSVESSQIKTTGEIKADEGRVFHINSIVPGRVVKDYVSLGQVIKEGQLLAIVQNLEVSKVYGDYIHQSHQNEVDIKASEERLQLFRKTLERAQKLYEAGIAAQKEVLAAQNQVNLTQIELNGLKEHGVHIKAEAEAMLSAYGVKLSDTPDPSKVETGSPLKSPRAGVVIQKNITMGDVVTADQPLYVVADLSKVWLDVAVYDKDLDSIELGQKLSFRTDSLPNREFEGTVSYIPPSASNMRTFTARAVLPNPGLLLKPGMFAQVIIEKGKTSKLPYLPDSAIQKFGNETFAFLALGNNKYQKRTVELGERMGDGYIVKTGLSVGDRVATEGSFTLKAELLKSQLGQDD